jgi:hypothetical protein
MDKPTPLQETPILVQCLAKAIGTSAEDASKSLAEYDKDGGRGLLHEAGLTLMLRDLVATG